MRMRRQFYLAFAKRYIQSLHHVSDVAIIAQHISTVQYFPCFRACALRNASGHVPEPLNNQSLFSSPWAPELQAGQNVVGSQRGLWAVELTGIPQNLESLPKWDQ